MAGGARSGGGSERTTQRWPSRSHRPARRRYGGAWGRRAARAPLRRPPARSSPAPAAQAPRGPSPVWLRLRWGVPLLPLARTGAAAAAPLPQVDDARPAAARMSTSGYLPVRSMSTILRRIICASGVRRDPRKPISSCHCSRRAIVKQSPRGVAGIPRGVAGCPPSHMRKLRTPSLLRRR